MPNMVVTLMGIFQGCALIVHRPIPNNVVIESERDDNMPPSMKLRIQWQNGRLGSVNKSAEVSINQPAGHRSNIKKHPPIE